MKNLRLVGGKSLICRAIECGNLAHFESTTYVSSDSQEILDLATLSGANPHFRSEMASNDDSTAEQVVSDFISNRGLVPSDVLIYLQPTSPMRKNTHVNAAFNQFLESGHRPLVSVKLVSEHPYKMLKLQNTKLVPYDEGFSPTQNRQTFESVYIPNGAIYIFSVRDFIQNGGFPIRGSEPFFMGEHESLDVDTEFDLKFANLLMDEIGSGDSNE